MTLIVNAKEIFVFVLGHGTDKWVPGVTAFEVLCVYGIIRIILEPVGNVLLALGKPGILLKANLVAGVIEIGLLYPAIKYGGINPVAVLVTAAYAIQYLIYFPYLEKECEIKAREIISVLKLPALCGFGIAVSAVVVGRVTGFSVTSMLIKAFFCTIGYFSIFGLLTQWIMLKEGRAIFEEIVWRIGQ